MLWILLSVLALSVCISTYLKVTEKPDGEIVIRHIDGKTVFSLEIDKDPDDIPKMKKVTFKVVDEDSQDKHGL